MPDDLTCIGCGATVDCSDIPFSKLYSLQNPTFPFVLFCPEGYNCQQGDSITMVCCNQTLSAPIPVGSSDAQRNQIIQGLVNQCVILQSACGDGDTPTVLHPVVTYYLNRTQTCTVYCPDGTPFSYTQRAGTILASNQAKADAQAYTKACRFAKAFLTCPPTGCRPPTPKTWTSAALTGQFMALGTPFCKANPLVTSTNKLWIIPSALAAWFVDTYDITAGSPIPVVHIFPTDGAFPFASAVIYVPGANKVVMYAEHWNGASYIMRLYFLSATGTVLSFIDSLTNEVQDNLFVTVDNSSISGHHVGWLSGSKLFLLNVDTGTVEATANLPGSATGLCYSCVTDSFFTLTGDLLEYNRSDLALKNTYVGGGAVSLQVDYVKSTKELWLMPSTSVAPVVARIVDPKTGALIQNFTLADSFDGWSSSPALSHFYHDTLDAFCVPGPMAGFSGNPIKYYFYDVKTRALKASVDTTAKYQVGLGNKFFSQSFNLAKGSVYLASGYNMAGDQQVFEIGGS